MQRPIYGLKLGEGSHKVLAWSQMHGNETTTTKACLDLVEYLQETAKEEPCSSGCNFS